MIAAYTALHYGKEYLAYAIRSVIDAVDEYWVLYSPVGSHGYHAAMPCPETQDKLRAIAEKAAGNKLHWITSAWSHEGAQRDSIHQYVPDADVILVLDADEIWPDGLAWECTQLPSYLTVTPARIRLPMVHFWRSFYRAILHDPAFPERVIYPKITHQQITTYTRSYLGANPNIQPICHMGYAQRPEIVQYKQWTHGHRGQWRQDGWFENRFMANAQTDCHPVGSVYWNAEPVDPWQYMPAFMREHPWANCEVIE